jgi:hypothetical protein
VHLASAIIWVEALTLPVTMMTFDRALAAAARDCGLETAPEAA